MTTVATALAPVQRAEPAAAHPDPAAAPPAASIGSVITPLRVGVTTLWLSVIVLLPLVAIAWQAGGRGWEGFRLAVTSHAALESFRVTLTISVLVTVLDVVFGLATAWVLVRDDFIGKGVIDALIDLPFALPTIVTSLVMLALYGNSSPIGIHLQHTPPGVAMALAFVTLPLVVRAVQPVLMEIDRDVEEAAAALGLRIHLARGSMTLGRSAGGLPPDTCIERDADVPGID